MQASPTATASAHPRYDCREIAHISSSVTSCLGRLHCLIWNNEVGGNMWQMGSGMLGSLPRRMGGEGGG